MERWFSARWEWIRLPSVVRKSHRSHWSRIWLGRISIPTSWFISSIWSIGCWCSSSFFPLLRCPLWLAKEFWLKQIKYQISFSQPLSSSDVYRTGWIQWPTWCQHLHQSKKKINNEYALVARRNWRNNKNPFWCLAKQHRRLKYSQNPLKPKV